MNNIVFLHDMQRGVKVYPFQNKNLKNFPGEKWKEIPDWPNYEISNYGRVKSAGRWIELGLGKKYYKEEKILSQQIISRESPFNGDILHYLAVGIQDNNYRNVFRTSRLVYYLFVKKFQIEDIKQIIQYKDGDGLNVHSSNLILSTHSIKTKKTIEKGRTPKLKKVTQFTLDGKKIKTYTSMSDAAVAINGQSSRIYTVLDKWPHYYKGYLWAIGDRKKTEPLSKPLINHPKKVVQFTFKGKQLKTFPSLTQAANHIGATNSNLRKALNGKCRTCKGFKWQWGNS